MMPRLDTPSNQDNAGQCIVTEERRVNLPNRVYDWILRRRLIRGPQWGQSGFAQRLLRMRLLSAVVLSLPALVLCVWYSLSALAAHVTQVKESKVREPLTVSLFQLHLHDRLVRDWQRLIMPEPRRKSPLPTYGLALTGEKLDWLDKHLPPDDEPSNHVDGLLIRNSRKHDIQVRYLGGKFWHYQHAQKSWKVRVKDGRSVDGFETFNFINPPEAVPFEEDIVLEIAREQGLLTPEYFPFRLLLNKAYMGVYFFEAQPDEGLPRRESRPAGSIYSSSEAPIDPATGVNTLFRSAEYFTKLSQGIQQQLGERKELEALIQILNKGTPGQFAQYANQHLDVEKFAIFDALDVAFGCNQHDFGGNHKLFYDPYRDRFEPIAWNFRGCKHDTEFNRTENPLLLRLKQLPSYLTRRNRVVYQLLRGGGSPESLRERTRKLIDELQADQLRNPHWDASQLLPAMSPYYSQLLRPMNRSLQDIATETRIYELERRKQFLTGELTREAVRASILSPLVNAAATKGSTLQPRKIAALDVVTSGESGYRIARVEPHWAADCRPQSWQLFADTKLNDHLDLDDDLSIGKAEAAAVVVQLNLEVYPGVRFEPRPVDPSRGKIRSVTEPRRYRLFLQADACELTGATLDLENLVTAQALRIVAAVDTRPTAKVSMPACDDKYQEEPGYSSPHPWCLNSAKAKIISLGPGVVQIRDTRTFAANQSVVIVPGTTLRMSENASLLFYGHLDAVGTPEQPIRLEPIRQSWGGIALQGPATRGSHLSHVTFSRGTHPDFTRALWPGVLNIQDTARITVDHCQLIESPLASVGLHVASTQELNLQNSRVSDISGDAIQLKYSTATLDHLIVFKSGRDGLVVTGSQAVLRNGQILTAQGNSISVGQVATLSLQDSLLADAACGMYVHEAATLEQSRVLLYDNQVGARLDPSDDKYPGKARLKGDVLYAVKCKMPFQVEGKHHKTLDKEVVRELAQPELEPLRVQVLQLPSWDALDKAVASGLNGELP
jgi:hypothetical protein